ncbi:phage tail tube protein [Vibrio sp. LaRot3]|uniref:phage tail tube protein n=1 Tax=Vibrio sp. LaRot3 TaxID=2998829 RepID=UPI0022CDE378|nr:phage tail tube protein [Vibrio sp. LaRot3]MDA0148856.1 phage tail tube protein [Vibrio sp. LaRot3]
MLFGVATVRCNGTELKTTGTAKFFPGGYERESKMGGGKVRGHTEKFVAPYVEAPLAVDEDVDVIEINNIRDATITFECDNGLKYIMTGSALESPIGISEGGETDPGKWIGKKAKKA